MANPSGSWAYPWQAERPTIRFKYRVLRFFLQYQKIRLISHAYNFDRIMIRAIIGIIAYLILQRLPKKVRPRLKLGPELRLILG